MNSLSKEDFHDSAEPILRQVFAHDDLYHLPFADVVEERRLLSPVYYRPERHLFRAIVNAAREIGDSAFYLYLIERPVGEPFAWYIQFSEVDAYYSMPEVGNLENAIFSPSGQWGMMFSQDWDALLGGTRQFMSAVERNAPSVNKLPQQFVSDLKHGYEDKKNNEWLKQMIRLLCHIYDELTVSELLQTVGLPYMDVDGG